MRTATRLFITCLILMGINACSGPRFSSPFVAAGGTWVYMFNIVEAPRGHLSGTFVVSSITREGTRIKDKIHNVSGGIYHNDVSLQIDNGILTHPTIVVGKLRDNTLTLTFGNKVVVFHPMSQKDYHDTLLALDHTLQNERQLRAVIKARGDLTHVSRIQPYKFAGYRILVTKVENKNFDIFQPSYVVYVLLNGHEIYSTKIFPSESVSAPVPVIKQGVPSPDCQSMLMSLGAEGSADCGTALLFSDCTGTGSAAEINVCGFGHGPSFVDVGSNVVGIKVNDYDDFYAYSANDQHASLSGADSPCMERLLVFQGHRWRVDKPGEFPSFYKKIAARSDRRYKREAAKYKIGIDTESSAAHAIEAAYYSYMMTGSDSEGISLLKHDLPLSWRPYSNKIWSDIRGAGISFNPVKPITYRDSRIINNYENKSYRPTVTISDNLDAYYLENVHTGEVLVIEGKVFNKSSKPVSFVKIEGKLFNRNDVAVLTQSCYAGNQLTRRQIMALKLSEIEAEMMKREGPDLKDVLIPPHGEAPFVLVFHNLPAISSLTNYSVNVVSSQIAVGPNASSSGIDNESSAQTAALSSTTATKDMNRSISSATASPSLPAPPAEAEKHAPTLELVYSGKWADYSIANGDIKKNVEPFESSGCFDVELHSVYKGAARANMIKNVKKMLNAGEMIASPEGGNPDRLRDIVTKAFFDTQKKTVTFSGIQAYMDANNKTIGTKKIQVTFDLNSPKYFTLGQVSNSIESLLRLAKSGKVREATQLSDVYKLNLYGLKLKMSPEEATKPIENLFPNTKFSVEQKTADDGSKTYEIYISEPRKELWVVFDENRHLKLAEYTLKLNTYLSEDQIRTAIEQSVKTYGPFDDKCTQRSIYGDVSVDLLWGSKYKSVSFAGHEIKVPDFDAGPFFTISYPFEGGQNPLDNGPSIIFTLMQAGKKGRSATPSP